MNPQKCELDLAHIEDLEKNIHKFFSQIRRSELFKLFILKRFLKHHGKLGHVQTEDNTIGGSMKFPRFSKIDPFQLKHALMSIHYQPCSCMLIQIK